MTRVARHHDPGNTELLRHQEHVHRPRPTEPDEREVGGIEAPMHRYLPNRAGHLGDRDAKRSLGEADQIIGFQLPPDRAECLLGQTRLQAQPGREGAGGGQPSEQQIGIGDGGLRPPPGVAGRAWHRAGAAGAHIQGAVRLDPGDGAAAGPNRVNIELRHLKGKGVNPVVVRHPWGELADKRDVGARPAHVERDDILEAGELGYPQRAGYPADRTREKGPRAAVGGVGERHRAAVGAHDRHRRGDPASPKGRLQGIEIDRHGRGEVGVQYAGGRTFELSPLGGERGRLRHRDAWHAAAQRRGQLLLIGRVEITVDQGDRDRLHVLLSQSFDHRPEVEAIDRLQDSPVSGNALGDFQAAISRHDGGGALPIGFEQAADEAPPLADLEDVAKALRRHQGGGRAVALEQRIGGNRGAVHEGENRLCLDAQRRQGVQHPPPLLARQRGHLGRAHARLAPAVGDDVGERTTDIDADQIVSRFHPQMLRPARWEPLGPRPAHWSQYRGRRGRAARGAARRRHRLPPPNPAGRRHCAAS